MSSLQEKKAAFSRALVRLWSLVSEGHSAALGFEWGGSPAWGLREEMAPPCSLSWETSMSWGLKRKVAHPGARGRGRYILPWESCLMEEDITLPWGLSLEIWPPCLREETQLAIAGPSGARTKGTPPVLRDLGEVGNAGASSISGSRAWLINSAQGPAGPQPERQVPRVERSSGPSGRTPDRAPTTGLHPGQRLPEPHQRGGGGRRR